MAATGPATPYPETQVAGHGAYMGLRFVVVAGGRVDEYSPVVRGKPTRLGIRSGAIVVVASLLVACRVQDPPGGSPAPATAMVTATTTAVAATSTASPTATADTGATANGNVWVRLDGLKDVRLVEAVANTVSGASP